MSPTIVIPRRFNGPPASANGGYAAGLVAALLGGEAEVTLRSPPPLERELEIVESNTSVEVRDGANVVAVGERIESVGERIESVGERSDWELELPEPVSLTEAEEARKRYAGFRHHAYPTCFTCGPDRSDGLGVFPGPVEGRDVVAAPWLPPAGGIPPEYVWAALDCPAGWAIDTFNREGVLLGRIAARLLGAVESGVPYVVVGWRRGAEGRKREAGSAVFTAEGEPVAYARSTWIVPRVA